LGLHSGSAASLLRREESLIRLVPGILALLASAALAVLNIGAYVRHLDSGDQAGFALGNLFLVVWFLPTAAVLLLAGSILFGPPRTGQERRPLRTIVMVVLIAGAVFFLAYGLWQALASGPGSRSGGPFIAILFAFAVNVFACAIAVRPDSKAPSGNRSRLISGTLLAASAVLLLPLAASVASSTLAKSLRSGMEVAQLLFMTWPILAWAAALLWSALLLWRGAKAAQASISGSREVEHAP